MKQKILIVDDDNNISELISLYLLKECFDTKIVNDGEAALTEYEAWQPNLILLDLMLPGIDGYQVCREIRKESQVPIIMLTSSDSEFDELMSMNLGADDYVTKPYNPAVLLSRIQSVLRRTQRTEPPTRIEHRGVVLDVARGRVEHGGRSVDLTRNELKILHMLMANHDTIISRQELMVELWQSDAFIDDNTLTVNINRLRKSLASIGVPDDFLVTRRGQGYVV